jgi:carbon-monoxide dehydrogenase small subunit
MRIDMKVNGEAVSAEVEDRMTLADFLRDRLDFTGTQL